MINLNVRKLEDPKELMGGEHVPQHDRHGLQTCKCHRINRETLGSGSHMPPSARAASPSAFQHHLDEHKSHSRQEHSSLSQPAKAPLPRGCPSFQHKGSFHQEGGKFPSQTDQGVLRVLRAHTSAREQPHMTPQSPAEPSAWNRRL